MHELTSTIYHFLHLIRKQAIKLKTRASQTIKIVLINLLVPLQCLMAVSLKIEVHGNIIVKPLIAIKIQIRHNPFYKILDCVGCQTDLN